MSGCIRHRARQLCPKAPYTFNVIQLVYLSPLTSGDAKLITECGPVQALIALIETRILISKQFALMQAGTGVLGTEVPGTRVLDRGSVVGRETALMNNVSLVRSLTPHLKQTISIRVVNSAPMTHLFSIHRNRP